jgi:hypothetical protein
LEVHFRSLIIILDIKFFINERNEQALKRDFIEKLKSTKYWDTRDASNKLFINFINNNIINFTNLLDICRERNHIYQKHRAAMVDQNQPKSFFGNHLSSWPGFDPRDGKFLFLLFYLIWFSLSSESSQFKNFAKILSSFLIITCFL